jgi:hypothetical protein
VFLWENASIVLIPTCFASTHVRAATVGNTALTLSGFIPKGFISSIIIAFLNSFPTSLCRANKKSSDMFEEKETGLVRSLNPNSEIDKFPMIPSSLLATSYLVEIELRRI